MNTIVGQTDADRVKVVFRFEDLDDKRLDLTNEEFAELEDADDDGTPYRLPIQGDESQQDYWGPYKIMEWEGESQNGEPVVHTVTLKRL